VNALCRKRWQQSFCHEGAQRIDHFVRAARDCCELNARAQARRIGTGVALAVGVLERSDAHHEEFIKIRGSDRTEFHALEERVLLVGRFLQHTVIEREPGQLPIEELRLFCDRKRRCHEAD
jgi:hypothetical protein